MPPTPWLQPLLQASISLRMALLNHGTVYTSRALLLGNLWCTPACVRSLRTAFDTPFLRYAPNPCPYHSSQAPINPHMTPIIHETMQHDLETLFGSERCTHALWRYQAVHHAEVPVGHACPMARPACASTRNSPDDFNYSQYQSTTLCGTVAIICMHSGVHMYRCRGGPALRTHRTCRVAHGTHP